MNTDVITALAVAAAELEKSAGLGKALGTAGKWLGDKAIRTIARPTATGYTAGKRTIGTPLAAAYGYGQYRAAQASPDTHPANVFSYFGHGDAQAQHNRSLENWRSLDAEGNQKFDAALNHEINGKNPWYNPFGWGHDSSADIDKQMTSGTYGKGYGPALGGLNPFYRPGMQGYAADVSRINVADQANQKAIQSRMQARNMDRSDEQWQNDISGAGNEAQAERLRAMRTTATGYNDQLKAIQSRMDEAGTVPAIKAKMRAGGPSSGMGSSGMPASYWQHRHPAAAAGGFGPTYGQHDYRHDPGLADYNAAVWQDFLARAGQQGVTRPH